MLETAVVAYKDKIRYSCATGVLIFLNLKDARDEIRKHGS